LWLGAASGALWAAFAAQGAAQDAATAAEEGFLLETIVVSGEGEDGEASVLATRVDREELDERQIQDFEDLARSEAGVSFDRASGSINFRGLGDDRILTTVDGIRLPWLNDGARGTNGGIDSIDFNGLSSLDLVRGGDSSRSGSGNLAGRVELRTLDPEDLIFGQERFGTLAKTGYDSEDESWFANAAVATRIDDTWLLVQGGYRRGNETDNQGDVGGYGATRSEANPADFDQYSLLVKLHQYIDGGHRFGITGELFSRDEDTDLMTSQGTTYAIGGNTAGDAVDRQRISLSYDFDAPEGGGLIDEASAIVYWQRQVLTNSTDAFRNADARAALFDSILPPFLHGFNPYRWPTGIYQRENEIEEQTIGFLGDVTREFSLGSSEHRFTVGTDVALSRTEQYSSGVDNCPAGFTPSVWEIFGPASCGLLHTNQADMPLVDGVALGVFAEDEIAFFDGRLRLTPGVRFDYYERNPELTDAFRDSAVYDGTLPPSSSDWAISPKLLAEVDVTENLTMYAQWAHGFRAPSANELYLDYGAVGTYRRIGNPDLDAETSRGFEIGGRYDDGSLVAGVGFFNTWYKNFIDTVQIAPPGGDYPLGGISGYVNRANVQIWGFEANAGYQFDSGFRTWGSVAYAEGRDTDTDTYLNSVAPLQAILGVGYVDEEWGVDAALRLAAARDNVANPGTDFEAPGYGVVDLTAWYEPAAVPGLRIQAGVYNVFDKTYYDAVNLPDGAFVQPEEFYSEPGRTFMGSLTYTF
jgi:hemoglobin/transferrin/lactoferrin receptor protein